MQLILYGVIFFFLISWIADGILKATGWNDKESRRAAKAFIFTSMLNDKTPKGK